MVGVADAACDLGYAQRAVLGQELGGVGQARLADEEAKREAVDGLEAAPEQCRREGEAA